MGGKTSQGRRSIAAPVFYAGECPPFFVILSLAKNPLEIMLNNFI
jgi:hypothetical protein